MYCLLPTWIPSLLMGPLDVLMGPLDFLMGPLDFLKGPPKLPDNYGVNTKLHNSK